MDWDAIMKGFEDEALRAEMELLSTIPESDDSGEVYKAYLEAHEENAITLNFLKKIRDMDSKLDKILEKLG